MRLCVFFTERKYYLKTKYIARTVKTADLKTHRNVLNFVSRTPFGCVWTLHCSAIRRIWPLWCGSFLGQKSERHLSNPCQVFQVCKECHFCFLCLRCIARLSVWVYKIVNAEKYYFSWIIRSSWIKPGQLKTNIGKILDRNDARVADVGCQVDGMRSLIPFQCHEYDALNDQS